MRVFAVQYSIAYIQTQVDVRSLTRCEIGLLSPALSLMPVGCDDYRHSARFESIALSGRVEIKR